MIRTIILCLSAATPAFADGQADYQAALLAAALDAQREDERLGIVDIGFGADGRADAVGFYKDGVEIEGVFAEIVAVHDDTANICMWGYQTDLMPSLPRTAAFAVKAQAENNGWPSEAEAPWNSTTTECTARTNLATSVGDLDYIGRLAVGPYIVYFGMATKAVGS
ncbi:hypothetical protein ACJ5NV_14115 [Loktanella agnita]|uniref:hypothetical protein n=1 Tax=Loktanella agnita TaxID=287097 RepID=UPI0039865A16